MGQAKSPKLVGWAACATEIRALRERVATLESERAVRTSPQPQPGKQSKGGTA